MDPDVSLQWILEFAVALDRALEDGASPDHDSVYAMVGLVIELDRWLTEGRALPARWRPAAAREQHALILFDATPAASNDGPAARTRASTPRRKPLARRRSSSGGAGRAHEGDLQLALPFAAG